MIYPPFRQQINSGFDPFEHVSEASDEADFGDLALKKT